MTISEIVRNAKGPLAMPVATFPGTVLTGMTVRDIVGNAAKQAETQIAFQRRFGTNVLMSCMDLSVEAEAFGSTVTFSDTEVPTVTGRLVRDEAGAAGLPDTGSPALPDQATAELRQDTAVEAPLVRPQDEGGFPGDQVGHHPGGPAVGQVAA